MLGDTLNKRYLLLLILILVFLIFMLTIKDLELIRCVAETGSLTAAAKQMHVSQSAVSQRLANLQERIDVTLVERRDGFMQLTPAGRRVHMASTVVAEELNATMRYISELAQQQDEQLRIATQCYTCYRWLPFVINAVRQDFPSLNIDVVPEATDNPYEALRRNQIDVALVSNPVGDPELPAQELFSDELFAVMHTKHELAKEKYLDATQFSDQPLIVYTGNRHAIVDEILAPAGVTPHKIVQVRITEAIIELARSGQGIAVIAGWALDDIAETEGLAAVRITKGGFKRTWHAVIGANCNEDQIDSFLRHVLATGAAIQNRAWRKKLQAESGL